MPKQEVRIKGNYRSFYSMRIIINRDKWYMIEGQTKPAFECPKCGDGILGNGAPHSIEANGDVNASVYCENPDCTFHAMVRLEGWEGGSISRGRILGEPPIRPRSKLLSELGVDH